MNYNRQLMAEYEKYENRHAFAIELEQDFQKQASDIEKKNQNTLVDFQSQYDTAIRKKNAEYFKVN
jgi:hypothetical protein